MIQRMDLKVDFAFKQLFGQKHSEHILIAFLNSLLGRNEANRIASVKYLNTDLVTESDAGKSMRLDVYVVTGAGEHFNVEMQVARGENMEKRTLFYWATLFTRQGKKGKGFGLLNRTIAVNLVNYKQFFSTPRYHTSYHITEDAERFRLSDVLELHFVELPKWRTAREGSLSEAVNDPFERWLVLLDASDDERKFEALKEVAITDKAMEKALDLWEAMSLDDKTWAAYMSRDKALRDEASREEATKRAEAAREKAEADRERAEAEARKLRGEILAAHEHLLQAARALLAKDVDIATVSAVTGIPAKDIQRLQDGGR